MIKWEACDWKPQSKYTEHWWLIKWIHSFIHSFELSQLKRRSLLKHRLILRLDFAKLKCYFLGLLVKTDNISFLDIIIVFSSSHSYWNTSSSLFLLLELRSLHHFPSPNPVSINFLPVFTSLTSSFSFLLHFMESQSSENNLTLRFQAWLSKLLCTFCSGCTLWTADAAPMSWLLKFTDFRHLLSSFLRKPEIWQEKIRKAIKEAGRKNFVIVFLMIFKKK